VEGQKVRICIAQIRVRAAALETNFKAIRSAVETAVTENADVILLPEMCLPGYFIGDLWESSDFLRRCEVYHQKIAQLSHEITIIFGSVGIDGSRKNEDGRVRKYNAAYLAESGALRNNTAAGLRFWPKSLMPNYREFDDSRHFFDLRKLAFEREVPLQTLLSPVCINLKNGTTMNLGIGLCEDGWDVNYSSKPYDLLCRSQSKPDILVNLSCSPYTRGKSERRRQIFSDKSALCKTPLFYVNAVGMQNVGKTVYTFDGQSGIYSSEGFAPVGEPFAEAVVTHDLPEWLNKTIDSSPTETLQTKETFLAIETGLHYIRDEWHLNKAVIGVSGGIDSALSATLHARVFGPENVSCVTLPSRFNSQLTQTAAAQLAQNLGCRFASLSIEQSVALTEAQLAEARTQGLNLPQKIPQLVRENIQARDRGARLISATAASLGAVFPCNANKTELTAGYSTLYGDQAGYLAPLGDLWKGEVYALARYYNDEVFDFSMIPEESLNVTPSAELSEEQDISAGHGDPFDYPYHDALFKLWVESWDRFDLERTREAWHDGSLAGLLGLDSKAQLDAKFPTTQKFEADLERWWRAYTGMGAFKRMQAPPVLALSRRAFGFDHREAIGLHLMRGK